MVIKEYAISPELLGSCDDPGTCGYLDECFSFGGPRRVARYPGTWLGDVLRAAQGRSEIGRARVEALASKLWHESSSRRARDYDSALSWSGNVMGQMESAPFDGALCLDGELVGDFVLPKSAMPYSGPSWEAQRSACVASTPEARLECICPLIVVASRLVLVDPYAMPTPDYATFMLTCAETAKKAWLEKKPGITIVTSLSNTGDRERFDSEWRREAQNIGLHGVRLTFWRVFRGVAGGSLHNRLVLTDVGGLTVGNSLGSRSKGQFDDIALLDRDSHSTNFKLYTDVNRFFGVEKEGPLVLDL